MIGDAVHTARELAGNAADAKSSAAHERVLACEHHVACRTSRTAFQSASGSNEIGAMIAMAARGDNGGPVKANDERTVLDTFAMCKSSTGLLRSSVGQQSAAKTRP